MEDWISALDRVVSAAGEAAGLVAAASGSEGSVLVWIWRDFVDGQDRRVAETRISARPDPFGESVALDVSAAAWLEEQRTVAWSQMVWGIRIESRHFQPPQDGEAKGSIARLTEDLSTALSTGWQLAHRNVDRLHALGERRDSLLNDLRARGIYRG